MVLLCISLMTNDVRGTNHGLYAKSILVIEKSIFNVAKWFSFFVCVCVFGCAPCHVGS